MSYEGVEGVMTYEGGERRSCPMRVGGGGHDL